MPALLPLPEVPTAGLGAPFRPLSPLQKALRREYHRGGLDLAVTVLLIVRVLFLRGQSIPTAEESREVCFLVQGESSSSSRNHPAYLTYEDFTIVRRRAQELFGCKFDPCFRPRLFLKAAAGRQGRVLESFLCRFVRKFARRERQVIRSSAAVR